MTKDLSNCCQAPIKATHGCDDDFLHGGKKCTCEIVTSWYVCEKCKQPCDVQVPIQNYTKESEPTQKLGWEEEFDSLPRHYGKMVCGQDNPMMQQDSIKAFIRKVEKEAYERGRQDALNSILNQ